jgi:hypothetical protein
MQIQENKTTTSGSRLTIIRTFVENHQTMAECRCSCGNIKTLLLSRVKSNHTRSCGCLVRDGSRSRVSIVWTNRTHGQYLTHTYRSWQSMKSRCTDPNATGYKNYGGRGIGFCDRWKNFPAFWEDMGERPQGTTLDRINCDLGYYKENCRWADSAVQAKNKRFNKSIEFRGRMVSLPDLAREFNVSYHTLRYRYLHGWSLEDAISKKPHTWISNSNALQEARSPQG